MLLALSMTCSYVAVAAVVSMQQPGPGAGSVRIPVVVYGDGEEQLSGLQFDLRYDASSYELVEVVTGAAAGEAGKEAIVSAPAPGTGRVLITGFNNTSLFDGHVATLVLRPLVPGNSAHTLAVENVLASDPLGYDVPVAYEDWYDFPPLPPEKAGPRDALAAESNREELADTSGEVARGDGEESAAGAEHETTSETGTSPPDALSAGGVAGANPSDFEYSDSPPGQTPNAAAKRAPGGNAASGGRSDFGGAYTSSRDRRTPRPTATAGGSTSPVRPTAPAARPPRAAGKHGMNGAEVTGPHRSRIDERPTGPRLAFLTPDSKSLAPPGTAAQEGLGIPDAVVVPAMFERHLGAVVVFGLVLFGVLATLRARVLDPARQRRRRRLP